MKPFIFLTLLTLMLGCGTGPEPEAEQDELASDPVELPNSMPASMKGYELYSWEEHEVWHFTVITGTNRLKTYEEITARNNTVDGGFIKFTVHSMADLRELLGRIPSGQFITWIANSKFVAGFKIPEEPVVDEVELFCTTAGLEFNVIR